ncbi:hypothetical protein pb186bvf_011614 [Paramecium bursaria]
MKPTRPPVRAFGNAVQPVLLQRGSASHGPVVTSNSYQAFQVPVQVNQRGLSPTLINRQPLKESIKYQENIPPQFFKQEQKQFIVPNSPHHYDAQIAQKDQIIRQQSDQIHKLQTQLSEKVHDYQKLQEKYNTEFKKFQDDLMQQLNALDLNIQQNDYTLYFMQEIERKASNLQNNISEQIKELQNQFENRVKTNENLQKNLQTNLNLRMSEDESYFKGEIDIIQQKLQSKLDKFQSEQIIQAHFQQVQNQYNSQLQHANSLLNKINGEKTEELSQVKQEIQANLQNLGQNVQQQLQMMFNIVNQNAQQAQQQQSEKKQLTQHIQNITNKFNNIQQQFQDKVHSMNQKSKQLENENVELQRQIRAQLNTIQAQQQELAVLTKRGFESPQLMQSPPVKGNSFFSNSTAAGINKIKSVKSTQQKNLTKKSKQEYSRHDVSKPEISLEDFADFNEDSIADSSNESFTSSALYQKKNTLQSQEFQNTHLSSINNIIIHQENLPKQSAKGHRNKSQGSTSSLQIAAIARAIKRSKTIHLFQGLLYLGKSNKPLKCTYSPGQHLSDADMGLYLLDDNGNPFQVTNREKDELIAQQLIQII